ncbi:hypothetical protein STRIP9103_09058 [Streptomyces ipomoeae 91-03]|uniref:Uncharacterized protein n=1 Tax=Streptomyces ipomoeae 91-03 TaxID=698759 RepID=L1L412_9ACTN|nr:hypothetical protein STRIP9103_09058 [Streptomyces ipomoeae 91-03]
MDCPDAGDDLTEVPDGARAEGRRQRRRGRDRPADPVRERPVHRGPDRIPVGGGGSRRHPDFEPLTPGRPFVPLTPDPLRNMAEGSRRP